MTGEEICNNVNDLTAAELECQNHFSKSENPGWFDSCCAEFCNADDDITGVHAEAKEVVSIVEGLADQFQTEQENVDSEYAS